MRKKSWDKQPDEPQRHENESHTIDGVRGTFSRTNDSQAQGIYEWEPNDLYNSIRITGDLHKPPRPPKLRQSMRSERRITTDGQSLARNLRLVSNLDEGSVPSSPSTPLRNTESPLTAMDDNYANYESIYRNRRFSDSSLGEVEKIDSQRLDALMKPYMTSANEDVGSPPNGSVSVATSSTPIYRTEVVHNPFNEGAYVGQQKNSVSICHENYMFAVTVCGMTVPKNEKRTGVSLQGTAINTTSYTSVGLGCTSYK
ncbi:hypothetical protein ACTXT7_006735 [Hymenolepis weldensis]